MRELTPDELNSIGNIHPKKKGYKPKVGFNHLDIPEPETLIKGMREVGFCPREADSSHGERLKFCINLNMHELGQDRTRIYVKSQFEPGSKY